MNMRYIGSVYKFHKRMYEGGTSQADVKATTVELYEFARSNFTGEVIQADHVCLVFARQTIHAGTVAT